MKDTNLLPTTVVGIRGASRVEVISDSAFRGWRGVVVRIAHPGSIEVRLTVPSDAIARHRVHEITLPFGESELKDLDAR